MGITNVLSLFGTDVHEESVFRILVPGERYELRLYQNQFMAKIKIENGEYNSIDEALRTLRSYLTGENMKRVKISSGREFFLCLKADGPELLTLLPRGTAHNNVPHPIDDRIHFIQLPSQQRAVQKFRGQLSSDGLNQKFNELRSWLKGKGLTPSLPALLKINRSFINLPLGRKYELHLECL